MNVSQPSREISAIGASDEATSNRDQQVLEETQPMLVRHKLAAGIRNRRQQSASTCAKPIQSLHIQEHHEQERKAAGSTHRSQRSLLLNTSIGSEHAIECQWQELQRVPHTSNVMEPKPTKWLLQQIGLITLVEQSGRCTGIRPSMGKYTKQWRRLGLFCVLHD